MVNWIRIFGERNEKTIFYMITNNEIEYWKRASATANIPNIDSFQEPIDNPDERTVDYFEYRLKQDQVSTAFNSDENYSSIINSFTSNQRKQRDLFIRKHSKYGAANIFDGDYNNQEEVKDALMALYTRMRDKLNRFKMLIGESEFYDDVDESIMDTLNDLANYANIGIIVYSGEWDGRD